MEETTSKENNDNDMGYRRVKINDPSLQGAIQTQELKKKDRAEPHTTAAPQFQAY